MAKRILAVSPHASNPVQPFTYLLHAALQESCTVPHDNDPHELATLVGLGFTAILAEGSNAAICRPHLVTFLRYYNVSCDAHRLEQLAAAIAEIICNAIPAFKVLGYPGYYDDFVSALVHALKSSDSEDLNIRKGIKQVLQELFELCG